VGLQHFFKVCMLCVYVCVFVRYGGPAALLSGMYAVYTYVCDMYVCVYIYTYIHTHTYIHIYTYTSLLTDILR
jgi:hypothetical protein